MSDQISISRLGHIIMEGVRQGLREADEGRSLYRRWLDIQKSIGPTAVLQKVWDTLDTDTLEKIINAVEEPSDGTESE